MTKKLKASVEFAPGKNDISWIGSNFKEHLSPLTFEKKDAAGLVEKPLSRSMNDTEIAAELAPDPVELGDVLAHLKTASHSEWYLFYVKDTEGTLWAVCARWDDGGWGVGALPVTDPGEWRGGRRVVSRCFSGPKTETLSPPESLALGLSEAIEKVKAAGYVIFKPV